MPPKLVAILICCLFSGCIIVDVGVTNPIPGLSTVAIAPFFNLSSNPTVDGRRFSAAYYTELQKTPGFQVVPVDVTERAIIDNQLAMNQPEDVLELARILDVDAVVIGAVTEFDPYYPQRLGLQTSWYSPYDWEFFPGVQADMYARRRFNQDDPDPNAEVYEHPGEEAGLERVHRVFRRFKRGYRRVREVVVRAQSPEQTQVFANAGGTLAVSVPQSSQQYEGLVLPIQPLDPIGPAGPGASAPQIASAPPLATSPNVAGAPPSANSPNWPVLQEARALPPANELAFQTGPQPLPVDLPQQIASTPDVESAPLTRLAQPDPHLPDVHLIPETPNGVPTPQVIAPPLPDSMQQEPHGSARHPESPQTEEAPLPDRNMIRAMPPGYMPGPNVEPVPESLYQPQRATLPVGEGDPALNGWGRGPLPASRVLLEDCDLKAGPLPLTPPEFDPLKPFMSYTRLFDGSDADLVANLRDYLEVHADMRSGGWEGYLNRSDDFIRFASFMMVREMLTLHGGEGKRRLILKFREYK